MRIRGTNDVRPGKANGETGGAARHGAGVRPDARDIVSLVRPLAIKARYLPGNGRRLFLGRSPTLL